MPVSTIHELRRRPPPTASAVNGTQLFEVELANINRVLGLLFGFESNALVLHRFLLES